MHLVRVFFSTIDLNMLSTQAKLLVENEILPTQNIGLLGSSQGQIYPFLPNLNGSLAIKESRRRRPTKLDEIQPVTINPNITRIPMAWPITMSNHCPTVSHRMPCRTYLGSSFYDANNNTIPQNSISRLPIPLNPLFSAQIQSKDSLSTVIHQNERTISSPMIHQDECIHYNSPLRTTDQDLFSSSSQAVSSKKSKQSKKLKIQQNKINSSLFLRSEYLQKQQDSICPNGLPSIIPASINPTIYPLSPPSSSKSSPTNIISDSSIQARPESRHYSPDQNFLLAQKPIAQIDPRYLQSVLTIPHSQYGIIPMAYSSIRSSQLKLTDMARERKERDDDERKSKKIPKSFTERKDNCESTRSKLSAVRKRKNRTSNPKDTQTKKQLRRMIRRNRLAVLKFMIQKRKQRKQHIVSSPTLLNTNAEQATTDSQLVEETHKPTLPDILASNLKITFDATQQIQSISLSYDRRRKPECKNERTLSISSISNNRLGLLIEAMELVETFRNHSNVVVPTNT